ncbi:uncharacterized protein THITE_2110076 [Thermothielavioides terrestris NRRL 8126]|uniref:NACHT-NTPase and P-loop NTPases N-terminal domain-containing protein n=1 Tax=Thermothielavioides terrestris (strain ATCC 38088 / NRRL 8126) TaxID=578455 RepID=G2QRE4_THETT|nr:uncharacterized protein THITE_2110076 [Thermothielavioides terrestris NRRL 8126]AEO64196.1 hypothetical protein THITE_2110076 [Thermothielavioides terrestris NRRL 8126]
MAEVLGVVASGIAVAQAAQSLGGAVVALARLWREVRDVPDAVRAVLDELELAGEVVAAIESELTAAAAAAGAAGVSESGVSALHARVVQRCRAAREELGALVRDLAADITSSRRRKRVLAGVRVALKKDVLEAYEKRLRRALRMLDSVVQLHLASALRRQPELVAAEVTKVLALRGPSKMAAGVPPSDERQVEADGEEEQQAMVSASRASSARSTPVVLRRTKFDWGFLGFSLVQKRCDGVLLASQSTSTSYRLRLSPPQWLLKKAWDLQISMAYSGWKTCFRQYVVVPNDSEIWDVFRRSESEFDELLRLFNNGLASPFSMDTHGHTLLHWAISFRPEFIEPLLRIGLDFYANPRNALDAYLLTENYYGPKAVLIHQAMLSHGVYDEADADTSWWAILRMLGNPQVFDSMLANVFPDLYQWPLDSRLSRLSEIVIVRDTNIRLIGRFLHPDGRFRLSDLRRRVPWYSQLFRPTHTVFDMLAAIYFKKSYDAQWRQTTYDRDMIDLWNETRIAFRDIAATADYCDLCSVRSKNGRTVLWREMDWIIRRLCQRSYFWEALVSNLRRYRIAKLEIHQIVHQILRHWLEDLQAGGKDLEVYGRAELAAFRRHGPLRWSKLPECKWSGFTFGSRPEEWSLTWEWDPDVEGLVGDFWAWTEKLVGDSGVWTEDPPLHVPGSWVDDVDDDFEDRWW